MLAAWIEERDQFSGFRIDPSQVWALMQIAVMAGEGEVGQLVAPAMLFGNNVFRVKPEERILVLPEAAVLAAVVCPLPHMSPRRGIDHVGD
jgi:hypothetical protein